MESVSLQSAQDWLTANWKIIVPVVVVVVGLLVAVYVFKVRIPYLSEGFENPATKNGTPMFAMVQVDWCPHCKDAKPAFESLKANWDGKAINGKAVQIRMLNGETQNADEQALIKKWGVSSYPSFVLVKADGSHMAFEGERTEAGMLEWLKKNL